MTLVRRAVRMVEQRPTVRSYPERISGYFTKEQRKRLEKVAWRKRQTVAQVLRELVDALK